MKPPVRQSGFTLIEILVSAGVFSILVLVLLNAISGLDAMATSQRRYLEAVSTARRVFDRMGHDLRTLVTESDATLLVEMGEPLASDRLSFMNLSRPASTTATPGSPADTYRLSRITYAIERDNPFGEAQAFPTLMRAQDPVYWSKADYDFDAVLDRSPGSTSGSTLSPLAQGVFRFEITWIRNDGTLCRDPRGVEDDGGAHDPEAPLPAGFIRVDLSQVKGFVLSLAVLDLTNLSRMENDEALCSSFRAIRTTESHTIAAHEWEKQLATAQPEAARKNIRILQRTYYFWQ